MATTFDSDRAAACTTTDTATTTTTSTSSSTTGSTTLPSPPFIDAPGLANLRDAGGYALSSQPGKAIRRGVLYRSADLTRLDSGGRAALRRLGITRVFDLRSAAELEKHDAVQQQQQNPPGALAWRFRNYSDGPQGFVKAYSAILAAAAEPDHPYAPFRTVLEHFASPSSPPSRSWCTAPPARTRNTALTKGGETITGTGVLVALILSLCGLDDAAVAHEYSLTDLGLASRREEIVRHLMQGETLFGDRERAERMVGARKENMLETLALIRERYGSVEGYVIDHLGLSPASVEQIRKNLVVDIAEGEEPLDWRSLAGLNGEPHR
ncbi:9dc0d81b-3e68-439f-8368-0a0289b1c206 [Thermothielavioides terrestris]|uniref:9dc0d81b-3e68-439f-8368-0a0289b1c206 n=1 Tax=Thermothielavioides terrestris TaxID=2587410 RepID=A0A446BBG1_9PEZI|nr:9dc0d81b-3e68-439f-8368-0a0289b1c206 [Thermothielavioides terrestris]